MLIHRHDQSANDSEWRAFIDAHPFGDLVAAGRGRDLAAVVPTQFVLENDEVLIHLARPNPVWSAIEENPRVMLSVAGDWSYIPSSWKAVGAEDPRVGIPTTDYAAVQLVGTALILDEPDDVAALLRRQLGEFQPDVDAVDPSEHGVLLRAIRGLRIDVDEVRAKFKYGGNVDEDHRIAIASRLVARGGPGDAAALRHLEARIGAQT